MKSCEQPKPDDTCPTILVIDDEFGPRESLRYLLKDDYHVLCVDSVAQGLNLLREQAMDAVITDIRMPEQNGITGLREIRKIDSELAVIILTGFAALSTAQEAIRHEASEYMEKPFDASEMRSVIRHHVEQTRLRRKRSRLLNEANVLEQRISNLQAEKESLAELEQFSAEFVHDLRNALTTLTCSSGILRQEVEELQQCQAQASSEAGDYLDMLDNAMRHCVDMLNMWQRLNRKDLQQQTRFLVHEFCNTCVEPYRFAAQASGAQVTFEKIGNDVELLGDSLQLKRVLTNLIQNAINALPAENGQVCVRSEIRDTSVCVSVSDNGCGISEENLKLIFSPDFSTRRAHGGMGLGLFIAQKVAQLHGGTLTVESMVNQGTTFFLRLARSKPA